MTRQPLCALALCAVLAAPALAGPEAFGPGPLIPDYGPIAPVEYSMPIPEGTQFRVAFDTATGADDDELNSTLTSAARFLNMHVAAGVPVGDIRLAVVVHGGAVSDVTTAGAGANTDLVAALLAHEVRVIVCGQSAAWYSVTPEDLLPGVEMALSAMTAHALLHEQGYSLNPF